MSSFKTGTFARHRVWGPLKALSPMEAAASILEVRGDSLTAAGKKLVLLDVDNTLLPWKSEDIPQSTFDWIAELKALDVHLCILSNTRHPERLQRLSDRLGVPFIRGKFKPNPAIYNQALRDFGVKPEEAIMIGDQLFTDVLGANRAGIDAIWVRKMANREFPGTKISRLGERIVRPVLYKAIEMNAESIDAPETETGELDVMPSEAGAMELLKRPIVRQFVKFCIVGGLSFLIDYCVRMTLMFAVPYEGKQLSEVIGTTLMEKFPSILGGVESPKDAFFPIAAFMGGIFGMTNSFLWNRAWTFKIRGKEDRFAQLKKFIVISCIGLGLNVLISSFLNHAIPGDDKNSARIATLVATAIVAFWNFGGQRLYAFRKKR